MEELIGKLNCKYIILSYNSEGFIVYDEILKMLSRHGMVLPREVRYNTYRGSRNLENRSIYVDEYLFLLKKRLEKNGKEGKDGFRLPRLRI